MKKFLLFLFIVCALNLNIYSQYQTSSPYLNDPDKAIGYVDSCARFWFKAYDPQYGGYYSNIDKFGNLITSDGTQKNLQNQSRDAYGFVRAFMLTGDTNFLQKARLALNFEYQHAWDNTNGGWYWELDKFGNPTSGNTNKTAYHQHYALVGPTAYYEATRDTFDLFWLMKGFNNNEAKLWDSRPGYFGYYDYVSNDWSSKNNKSFNSTVDAITTHLLELYLQTNDVQFKDKTLKIADNIMTHLVPSMDSQAIGFAETYDANWNTVSSETMTIMGHVLKAAWCLGRAYELNPDTTYLVAANKLFMNVYNKGYDHKLGGPYKDFTRTTGQMLMWGIPDTCKAWWQMEQAITSGLLLYKITKNPVYLQVADETISFFMNYFVDHVYGEVYQDRTRYGKQAWTENKGNPDKGGYHAIETGYYTYLYGNLFLQQKPVSLYYNFVPQQGVKTYYLRPVELPFDQYKIKNIVYNNQAYPNFNSLDKTITLDQGSGGVFKVTFELTGVQGIAENSNIPETFSLGQNYPNPFNPSTVISYSIPAESNVKITIYNILGSEIAKLPEGIQTAGNHKINFNAARLSSGVYIYRIEAESLTGSSRFTAARKMILMK